jgi:hypothetical protein
LVTTLTRFVLRLLRALAGSRGVGGRPIVALAPNKEEFQRFDHYHLKGGLLKYEYDRSEWQMIVESIAPDPQSGAFAISAASPSAADGT